MFSSSLSKEENQGKMKMEEIKGDTSVGEVRHYILNLTRINNEDDVDIKSLVEMKTVRTTILDSIKQTIILFVNSKLSINLDHYFAFATLLKTASWLRKELGSDVESTIAVV
ncbi:hypothetical protein Goshw_023167 [Gossypium schwendimanii]|uniref:Uncharacterized protein n=1 Tax=Gossypium schwendimanii TaxID=34291 RepID=A0A7J9N4I0_GOSSC|nr:hypothetical protein [Gossypium schwendimanii]